MESNIRQLRDMHRITQRALGDALGLSQQMVSRIERDRDKIQIDVLISLAEYFHVSTDCVLGYGQGEMEQPTAESAERFPLTAVQEGDSMLETAIRMQSAAAENPELVPVIEKLEQMNKLDRMALWQLLAALKRFL